MVIMKSIDTSPITVDGKHIGMRLLERQRTNTSNYLARTVELQNKTWIRITHSEIENFVSLDMYCGQIMQALYWDVPRYKMDRVDQTWSRKTCKKTGFNAGRSNCSCDWQSRIKNGYIWMHAESWSTVLI